MKRFTAIIAAGLVIFSATATGARIVKQSVFELRLRSCSDIHPAMSRFSKQEPSSGKFTHLDVTLLLHWVYGYLSGVGGGLLLLGEDSDIVIPGGASVRDYAFSYIHRYCMDHPQNTLFNAATSLGSELIVICRENPSLGRCKEAIR